jgi:hypothetical protein
MKYAQRIQKDFEEELAELSKDPSTTYTKAYECAERFVKKFAAKKSFNNNEYNEALTICIDLILDWFPDVTIFEFKANY